MRRKQKNGISKKKKISGAIQFQNEAIRDF